MEHFCPLLGAQSRPAANSRTIKRIPALHCPAIRPRLHALGIFGGAWA